MLKLHPLDEFMYKRFVNKKILEALTDTPIVMVAGPRQCGKTTLVKSLIDKNWLYLTFDDLALLNIAQRDPIGFIRNLDAKHVVLDEVQRIPELFTSIKQSVDENRKAGRFLLTGSANALLLPKLSDSLAGRMEVITLLPLSECEIRDQPSQFLLKLLSKKVPQSKETRIRNKLMDIIVAGGFPEPLSRKTEVRRAAWYSEYVKSLVQRDIREISNIENLRIIPRFLRLLSSYAGNIGNATEIGANVEISRQTVTRYIHLLELLFLINPLPAWHRNENQRLIKSPKIHFVDTGLLCALRGITLAKLNKDLVLFGRLLECYVFCELKRQASWLEEPINFFHFRDKDKVEVDFVLESTAGDIIGIEVKASSTLNKSDFKGLERLKNIAGNDFKIGILLYDGEVSSAFGDDLYAVPISALWN